MIETIGHAGYPPRPLLFVVLLAVSALPAAAGAASIFWTAPLILLAAMMIAWGAESAQFFMAQGFALAILAWLQTLPEFAVEAVLAWHQQTSLLLSNLAGALQLLTGLGWPLIYAAAAHKRRQEKGGMQRIRLDDRQGIQVVVLLACLGYGFLLWAKGSLHIYDSIALIGIYLGYLALLRKMPSTDKDEADDLEFVPRKIVNASKPLRVVGIIGLFAVGGTLIYLLAEPFLGSVLAVATSVGLPQFVAIKWIAPFVSEFPEKVSAVKWARKPEGGPSMALMNMVSSNINQWTLLAAMLPIALSLSRHSMSGLVFDPEQSLELLMTLGQALLGCLFLIAMELTWWEALAIFVLWAVQFVTSVLPSGIAVPIHWGITAIYLSWSAIEVVRIALGRRPPVAFVSFARAWHAHVRPH